MGMTLCDVTKGRFPRQSGAALFAPVTGATKRRIKLEAQTFGWRLQTQS